MLNYSKLCSASEKRKALEEAAYRGFADEVRLLLAYTAYPSENALRLACQGVLNRFDGFRCLNPADRPNLEQDVLEIIRLLLGAGAGPLGLDELYQAPKWFWDCAKALLDAGACASYIFGASSEGEPRREQVAAYFREKKHGAEPELQLETEAYGPKCHVCGCKHCQGRIREAEAAMRLRKAEAALASLAER